MKELWSVHKIKVLVSISVLALISILGWSSLSKSEAESSIEQISFIEEVPVEENESISLEEENEMEEVEIANQEILIDMKGQVMEPGVYRMKIGDRIIDAVEKAGGFMEGADTNEVNLAALLVDEMVIIVPKEGEVIKEVIQHPVTNESGEPGTSGGLVNINTATEEELTSLTGIGPSKAKAIIDHRTDNGLFKNIEDIMQVTGIGQKSFEKLRNEITVAN
ncbi:ComEA family DNA-binding protein [Bacillus sp. RO2]|uniref:helix-hairpin-helix domain-containing protein n=1 Tax=Bacillus sp. RO2 TaxID=2723913 RepID=UPI00145FC75C|nr:helix-hairpin-helix domain-containing protein [Bacillus sp. RO2]NMH74999.1 ComEA family DNA-binding protein [Bacillus sp. RO2]